MFEAVNVIAITLVVILNHFPGDKSVFCGIYLTLFVFVLTQFSLSKPRFVPSITKFNKHFDQI